MNEKSILITANRSVGSIPIRYYLFNAQMFPPYSPVYKGWSYRASVD
jgi:hypothetical protein